MAGNAHRATVGDYVTLVRGTTYKGALVGEPGPALPAATQAAAPGSNSSGVPQLKGTTAAAAAAAGKVSMAPSSGNHPALKPSSKTSPSTGHLAPTVMVWK